MAPPNATMFDGSPGSCIGSIRVVKTARNQAKKSEPTSASSPFREAVLFHDMPAPVPQCCPTTVRMNPSMCHASNYIRHNRVKITQTSETLQSRIPTPVTATRTNLRKHEKLYHYRKTSECRESHLGRHTFGDRGTRSQLFPASLL